MDHYLDILPTHAAPDAADVRAVMVCPASASEAERDTLSKIIGACGLVEGGDCRTVTMAGPSALPPRAAGAPTQWVVVFGIKPASVGLVAEVPLYAWTPEMGGRRYCFAERLALVGEDMARKKRLWGTIKSLKA